MKASALAVAKTLDEVEPLIFVKDNDEAKRLLVAWTLYRPAFTDLETPDGFTAEEAFDSLWATQEPVDFDRLGLIAGLPYLTTRKLFNRMITARLLYPDGTLSHNTRIVIQAEMRGYLKVIGVLPTEADLQPTSPPRSKQSPKAAARAS
jgi:hypothetical protein